MGKRPRRLFARALLAAMLAAALLAAWWGTRSWRQQWLAARLTAELAGAPQAELPARLRELALLDEPGLAALVALLESDRAELAAAAEAALDEQLAAWRQLPPHDASLRAATLARVLAGRVGKHGPAGDAVLRRLALELLGWPHEPGGGQNSLVADCELVLRAAPPTAPPPTNGDRRHGNNVQETVVAADGGRSAASRRAAISVELPGGGIPFDVARVPPLPPQLDERVTGTPRPIVIADEQPLISEPPERLPPPFAFPLPRPPRQWPAPDGAHSLEDNNEEPPVPPLLQGPDLSDAVGLSPAQTSFVRRMPPVDGELHALMRLLNDADPAARRSAETELRLHGLNDVQLELARRLTAGDYRQRRALAALLPRVPNIDARPWLLLLSRDVDERVRREALAVMTATRDPRLLEAARQANSPSPR